MTHPDNFQSASVAENFALATDAFHRKASELGYKNISNYHWYHTIELPGGLVTPGSYDYRSTYSAFGFPENMTNMTVLDIGSATGFFAFEFAKRGARVVSLELPSLYALDRFPGQTVEQSIRKIEAMMSVAQTLTPEQMYIDLLTGPFDFCRERLGLEIERWYTTVYEINDSHGAAFDLVFMGDILLHTINPLQALTAAAAVCKGTLVLAQGMPDSPDSAPAMLYKGGKDIEDDEVSWWWPNQSCLSQILNKLGFKTVLDVGHHTGIVRPAGFAYDRTILHAIRK